MKKFGKILSVGLSLALCAGMIAPAFAAQVLDNSNKGQFIGSNGALLGHDGSGGRGDRYDYELGESLELEKTLVIGAGVAASIDLKGNDLKHTGATGSVITIENGGELELDDTAAEEDENGNYIAGSVVGGKNTFEGGGVYIKQGGAFDLKGGKISGNQAQVGGGVANRGVFNMYGGEISDNKTTAYDGGGVIVWGQSTFNMYDGKITRNEAYGDGGGVALTNQSTFNMYDGEISYNKVPGKQKPNNNGGGIAIEITANIDTGEDTSSDFTMYGGSIIHNEAVDKGSNGISFYAPYEDVNESKNELAKLHIKINDDAVICNGDGENGMVEEQHEFVNWHVTIPAKVGVEGEETGTCAHCTATATRPIPALEGEENNGGNGGGMTPPAIDTPDTVEIEDEAVPLAGLFTRADAIGYLWQQSGEPEAELSTFEDVPEDHVWAVAIGWAQDMGIAVADQEGNFRPDDLVLRWVEDHEAEPEGELEEFLNRYAEFAGIELDADELFVELGGEPTDIVMGEDAQVIFDSFFAKLEEALEEQAA